MASGRALAALLSYPATTSRDKTVDPVSLAIQPLPPGQARPLIAALIQAIWATPPPAALELERAWCQIARDDSQPAGFALTGPDGALLVGVLPAYQDQGLGTALARAAGAAAFARGQEQLAWTLELGEGRLAYWSLHRLKAIGEHLRPGAGDGPDTLRCSWFPAGRRTITAAPGPLLNPVRHGESARPEPGDTYQLAATPGCRLALPADLPAMAAADPDLAAAWRAQVRFILRDAYRRHYVAVDWEPAGALGYLSLAKRWAVAVA